jgi:hypothetical protein
VSILLATGPTRRDDGSTLLDLRRSRCPVAAAGEGTGSKGTFGETTLIAIGELAPKRPGLLGRNESQRAGRIGNGMGLVTRPPVRRIWPKSSVAVMRGNMRKVYYLSF